MVDDVFRSYRNLDTAARDGSETSRGRIGDLLAELARLTGQGDPYRDGSRDDGSFQARKDDSSPEQRQRARISVPFGAGNHPLYRESTASRRRRHPTDRRSCPLCPMTATLARCGRPRLTKLTAPIAFTMASQARAGGSSW
jgi:hypothetical protein